jgi:hypothetical protein
LDVQPGAAFYQEESDPRKIPCRSKLIILICSRASSHEGKSAVFQPFSWIITIEQRQTIEYYPNQLLITPCVDAQLLNFGALDFTFAD